MKAVHALLLSGALVFAVTGAAAGLLVWRSHTPTADAATILQTAERMAVFPKLADPASVAAEFSVTLRSSGAGHFTTRCPGRPLQATQEWQSTPHTWWFDGAPGQYRQRPIFVLKLEAQPPVCPSDPLSAPVRVLFMDVAGWRCIHPTDLGDAARQFKTMYRTVKARIMRREIERPDGAPVRMELNFVGDEDAASCLWSVTLLVRNA